MQKIIASLMDVS